MTRGTSSLLALALCSLPAQAMAAEDCVFNVSGGALTTALPMLSRQGGVSISVADARLWQVEVKPVRGRMDIDDALRRMLAGTGARAVKVSATSWRERLRPHDESAARLVSGANDEGPERGLLHVVRDFQSWEGWTPCFAAMATRAAVSAFSSARMKSTASLPNIVRGR